MPLRFREDRVTQAAGRLLRRHGGRMPYLKLLKLLYLADRSALLKHGRPISFDRFVAMPHGPVLSRTYDLIASEPDPRTPSYWRTYISPAEKYEVRLLTDTPVDQLSPAEVAIIDEVFAEFGDWDKWKLVEFTHGLPEYRDPEGSSAPIPVRSILFAEGWSEEDVREVEDALGAEVTLEGLTG